MPALTGARPSRVALLSLHSHGDRSFLDDQKLALLSGDLTAEGLDNELLLCVLDPARGLADPVLDELGRRLQAFDVVVYDRNWDDATLDAARRAAGGPLLVWCRNEHEQPGLADWICDGLQRDNLPALVQYLRGLRPFPPRDTRPARVTLGTAAPPTSPVAPRKLTYAPNLHPTILGGDRLPADRTFSLVGNAGCPYQADARENPVYDGIALPTGTGRGCAFCTTGNTYVGAPTTTTAASVLDQLRYVRRHKPSLDRLVLKDQNPFGYLAPLVVAAADEGLGPFTLLLETRADWFLKAKGRLDEVLPRAEAAGIVIAPFLVGIENFSQPELDRLNKGVDVATNERFIEVLREWAAKWPKSFSLAEASFGFLMFTPWTTVDDLRTNRAAIGRTRFDTFRGSLLLSRARLYPDTALYYLARRDGLLTDTWPEGHGDNARRYGYHASHPWKFRDPVVAAIARLGTAASEQLGSRDQLAVLDALLAVVPSCADPEAVTVEQVLAAAAVTGHAQSGTWTPADDAARARFSSLFAPFPIDDAAPGPHVASLRTDGKSWRFELVPPADGRIQVELVPGRQPPAFTHTRDWTVRHGGQLTPAQLQLLKSFCDALRRNGA